MEDLNQSNSRFFPASLVKAILPAGLVAGTLDIVTTSVIYQFILGVTTAGRILQLIASGVFGKQSFERGAETMIYGLIFHYIIAFSWTILYFLIYPYLPAFLRKQPIISGLLYGIVVWLLMNLVVLPLSNVTQNPFKWDGVLIGVVTLMICIGLPVSLFARRFYASKISVQN